MIAVCFSAGFAVTGCTKFLAVFGRRILLCYQILAARHWHCYCSDYFYYFAIMVATSTAELRINTVASCRCWGTGRVLVLLGCAGVAAGLIGFCTTFDAQKVPHFDG